MLYKGWRIVGRQNPVGIWAYTYYHPTRKGLGSFVASSVDEAKQCIDSMS